MDLDKKRVIDAFRKIREERDEHLESINQLTNELQTSFEYISELEAKYDKLKEIIDELLMFKNSLLMNDVTHFSKTELSLEEQKLFLVLYIFGEKEPLSWKTLKQKIGMMDEVLKGILSSLLDKGIPMTKEKIGNEWYFNLDKRFREIQTKENIIKIHETVSKGIYERNLNNYF